MEDQHDCDPPPADPSKHREFSWTCPVCGDVWTIEEVAGGGFYQWVRKEP